MKNVLGKLVLLILAVVAARLTEYWAGRADLVQLVINVVVLAVGLAFMDRAATITKDLPKCLAAWGIFVALETGVVYFALLAVSDLPPAAIDVIDAPLTAFGWYPGGADAWFPAAISIWLVSTLAIVLVATLLAQFIRAIVWRKRKLPPSRTQGEFR